MTTATKRKPKGTKPKSDEHTLDDLVAAASGMLLDTPEIELLLGPDVAALSAGDFPQQTHEALARGFSDEGGLQRSGISAEGLVRAITDLGISYELSPIAIAMVEFDIPDFLDVFSGEMLEARQVQELLNIPVENIKNAFGTDHGIDPELVGKWIETEGIPHRLSIACVSQVLRRREMRKAIADERKREAEREPDLMDLTASALAAHEAQAAEQRERERQQRLATYRSLLARRNEPNQQDAERLAYLASELGFDTESIREHVKLLDKHDTLVRMHSELSEAERQEQKLAAQVEKLEETVKRLKDKQREHGRAQSRTRNSRRAEREAERLRQQHPDLFEAE